MTNYFFKIVIWLHYWLLHLKGNQITNYFQVTFKFTVLFKLLNLNNTLQSKTHSSFINLILTEKNYVIFIHSQ